MLQINVRATSNKAKNQVLFSKVFAVFLAPKIWFPLPPKLDESPPSDFLNQHKKS